MRSKFWGWREFRLGGEGEWRDVGQYGEELGGVLKVHAPRVYETQYGNVWRYRSLLGWLGQVTFPMLLVNLLTGHEVVHYNYVWGSLGLAVWSQSLADRDVQAAVGAYNQRFSEREKQEKGEVLHDED